MDKPRCQLLNIVMHYNVYNLSYNNTYQTANREMVTFEEAWPSSLLFHDTTWPPSRQTQALAWQFDATILTFGHVDGTEQGLDD